jgi:hypothetical protein
MSEGREKVSIEGAAVIEDPPDGNSDSPAMPSPAFAPSLAPARRCFSDTPDYTKATKEISGGSGINERGTAGVEPLGTRRRR